MSSNLTESQKKLYRFMRDNIYNHFEDPPNIPRERSRGFEYKEEDDQYLLWQRSRAGGNNRNAYQEMIQEVYKHPRFVRDQNDWFDETYTCFYFDVSDILSDEFRKIVRDNFIWEEW